MQERPSGGAGSPRLVTALGLRFGGWVCVCVCAGGEQVWCRYSQGCGGDGGGRAGGGSPGGGAGRPGRQEQRACAAASERRGLSARRGGVGAGGRPWLPVVTPLPPCPPPGADGVDTRPLAGGAAAAWPARPQDPRRCHRWGEQPRLQSEVCWGGGGRTSRTPDSLAEPTLRRESPKDQERASHLTHVPSPPPAPLFLFLQVGEQSPWGKRDSLSRVTQLSSGRTRTGPRLAY